MEKKTLISRIKAFTFPFKKSLSLLLIFVLLFSQTIRFDFMSVANASSEQYRDIVSIIVDSQTERQLRDEIRRYAEDIQNRLGSTRVVISVIDSSTTPAMIAAQNEKWYYEGDGEEGVKSQLVGTILLGNVPIPMVNADGKYFPSVFPYVDFENKVFLYNEKSDRYEQVSALTGGNQAVEIWHGVMNPAVGREWNADSDIPLIRDFLDKTHNFYQQTGRFAMQTTPPSVFYFDGFSESKSIELRRVFQYSLWIANVENMAYSRFSKYLLKDINNALKEYDKQNDSGYADLIASLGIEGLNSQNISSNTLSDELINETPDIHTKPIIEKLVNAFSEIFNTKVLGEELAAVHNAGRYNSGANVRADLGSVNISIADTVASDTLKKANDALEQSFTDFLKENSIARKIPILDGMSAKYGNDTTMIPYANYFFGQEGKNIVNAAQCTIARGISGQDAEFGQSILVESNVAFDVNATQSHVDVLGADAPRCYSGNTPKLQTFWGGNSLLRVANETNLANNPLTRFPEKKFTGFVKNIFSQEGMLESDRVNAPSLSQCMDYSYQYTVKQPYSWQVLSDDLNGGNIYTKYYPEGTNGTYFACDSQLDIIDENRTVYQTSQKYEGISNINAIPVRPDANFLVEAARYSNNTQCLVGDISIDGKNIQNNNSCIENYMNGENSYTIDNTSYRNLSYHTIDGILYHISPTKEEIAAADANGATPNLPIDINRSVEFLTKKGNIVTLQYPNFYRMNATTVGEVRAWLREDSSRQWQAIVEKENSTNQSDFDANISENILGAKNLPSHFDWNDYISDELIIQILQAKNWLHPDITAKYQNSVESMLSYSQKPSNGNILQKMPATSSQTEKTYEIAYLGLTSVAPMAGNNSNDDISFIQNDYSAKLAAIHGFNITEQDTTTKVDNSVSSSAHCGPPDGVDLFKWPSAVQCWIKSQIPVKISAGQCGGDTIGYDNSSLKPAENIPTTDVAAQKASIAQAKVIPHFSRKHISYHSSIDFSTSLQTDTARINPTNNSVARLEIISVTSGGKNISPEKYNEYFSYNSSDIPLTSGNPNFIITAKDKNFTLTARVAYDIRLTDGTIEKKFSENFVLTASSEYLDAYLSTDKSSNIVAITADSDEKIFINILRKKSLTDAGAKEGDFEVTIFDDLTGREIGKISGKDGLVELGADITKQIGVYRTIIAGKDGIAGEFTFSVISGQVANVVLNPVSSMILKDATTIVTLSLQDRIGNSVAADLYSIELTVENGSIIDSAGNPKNKLSLDIFDSNLSFMVRGDRTGDMKIFAKILNHSVNGNKELNVEKTIKVVDSAKVSLQFENPNNAIQIGSSPLPVRIQIRDSEGNVLSGFSSIATLSLPSGAGNFSKEIIEIKNGQTENFAYNPGTVAGIHNLTLNIPGIGIINNIPLTLIAGEGMYIDHTESNNQLIFSVRDRYGNLSNYSGNAFVTHNAEEPVEVQMTNGQYILPKRSGYYVIEIPELEKNKITYQEAGQNYKIDAITKYAVQIFTNDAQYQFADDYNARYTVLAGGSFLREAEDIIFHTDKNNSQSLAASTLLASPLADETIVSVFPNGGYSVGQLDDMVLETSLNLERSFPVLHITDSVRKAEIAKILYNFSNAELMACSMNDDCIPQKNSSTIAAKLTLDASSGYALSLQNGRIILSGQGANLFSVANNGSIEAQPSITLALKSYDTTNAFVFEVLHNGAKIAEISYHYSGNENISLVEDIFHNNTSDAAPKIQTSGYQIQQFSDKTLGNSAKGITVKRSLSYNIYDESKIGPIGIDDIGTLVENPGVGWMGDNRMLLSFAAGDTVGESTKWFHTYMLVNIGDPVASVNHGEPDTQIDGLDKSIGTQIADSRKSQIHDFFQKDMNADNLPDVLVQYSDGFMELLLNINGKFRSVGNIVYLPRLRNSLVQVADFQGDKFSDIISLDDKGELRLISNIERKFTEWDITLTNNTSAPRNIQQMKVLDMDKDGKDDLVYLTSSGQLGILYGTNNIGKFEQKILDETLGITLKQTSDTHGGALKSNFVAQPQTVIGEESSATVSTDPGLTDSRIRAQVYYQERAGKIATMPATTIDEKTASRLSQIFSDTSEDVLNSKSNDNTTRTTSVPLETYIRSQYASLVGMDVVKNYASKNNIIYPEDTISVEISIKNNNTEVATSVKYLDTIPEIFDRDNTLQYTVEVDGKIFEKNFVEKNSGDYSLEFDVGDIPAGATAKIRYTLLVLPASYGEMLVGDFEQGLTGHDVYGDIAFQTSTTCGAEMMTWYSREAREYDSSRRQATYDVPLPNGVADKIVDNNGNNIPDSVENMTPTQGMAEYKNMAGNSSEKKDLITVTKEGKQHIRIGFDEETAKNITDKTQEIVDGLACGFGGGSCMSFPINWAPLAPGNDPVVFGSPVGDGFKVEEGLPVFSALTAINVPTTGGCYQIPVVWPASPLKFQGSCTTETAAGGYLKSAPTNFVRVFATPTLTLGMGAAVCLGGPANVIGGNPGKGLSPLVQGGNCIVMAKAMPICKGDGSIEDGDISGISGLGVPGSGAYSTRQVWNGESCNLAASPVSQLREEEKQLEAEIIDYMRSPTTKTASIVGITAKISKRNISSLNNGPLLNIGGGGSDIEVSVTGKDKISDIGKVVNVNNKRISAFPDFIMDWLTRQTEELTNSLFTPPNLTIIPPTDFGQNAKVDSTYADFLDKLGSAYSQESLNSMLSEISEAYTGTNVSTSSLTSGGNSWLGGQYEGLVSSATSTITPALNAGEGGLNSMRAAYTYVGKLPFINIRETQVNINIPWILPRELDQYERKLKEYQRQIENAAANWCISGESVECLEAKVKLNSSGFVSSIQANLKRIEEYRGFPEKIQKYVTWKEKLLYDLLCNIEAVEKMTFGWIHDNGIRFQKWAELYVLIKAIAESWQPLLDIFTETNAQCGVCRNERHNSQAWKFKLISAIIPQIPVISFPKWPDIVLDLSDVRLGIDIAVPDFNFRISPLKLPSLPSFSLPSSPNANFSLPTLPILPALPSLPDLPELPSLPMVKLPDLPPPPKLPKLSGSIKASLDILKLISKMYCYYQKTVLIPEWQVGDVIAQRTERQGTLPMDFIDIQFPQFSVPALKEIRISTHLNYTLRTDFLTEFAQNAVKPINEFTTDLSNKIPSQIDGLEKAVDAVENAADQASDAIHDGVNQVEDAAQNATNSIQNASDNINNQSRQIENNLQNTSDNIETGTQNAVNEAAGTTSYNQFSSGVLLEEMDNLLSPIIAQMEADKDIFYDTEEFYNYFKNELIRSGFVAQAVDLDRKMNAARIDAQKVQKDIIEYNQQKFSHLREYIKEQERKTGEMQNIVDLLRSNDEKLLATSPYVVANLASENISKNSLALAQLADLEKEFAESIQDNSRVDTVSSYEIGQSLQNRVKRIAQLTTQDDASTSSHNITSSPTTSAYMPKFEGMYVLTERSHTQTKLFSYTELIRSEDRVDVLDIDNDGDKDYVFLLGDKLYVKNTHLFEPVKIIDKNIFSGNIFTKIPEVANNFTQVLSTPSELNISFRNTVSGEKEWRMEFYDKYLEWDRMYIKPSEYISTARTTVDLLLNEDFGDFQNGIRSLPVARYITRGADSTGFILEGPKIEKISNDIFMSISPNRTIYTGNNDIDIIYRTSSDSTEKTMTLKAHSAYQFESTTEIRGSGGDIYVIGGGTGNYKYSASDNLNGLPVLPGMRMTSSDSFVIHDATHKANNILSANSTYIVKSLGIVSDMYNFTIPYPNGHYYARLNHLSTGKTNRTSVSLIAPQFGSDATSPVVSLTNTVRVPVYSQEKFVLSDIITELSSYELQIDEDTSVDADGNGVYDDDFTSSRNNITISDHEIIFGPFDTPGNRQMLLKVRDEFGNTTYMPVSVEIFTPIPNIQTLSDAGYLSGQLDTTTDKEPIDFFRIRTSEYPFMINSDSVLTENGGQFSSGSFYQNEKIVVKATSDTFEIQKSGIFTNMPTGYETRVSSATVAQPMSIDVYDVQKKLVYQQFLSLPSSARIVDSSSSGTGNIVISPTEKYKLILAAHNDPQIPGGAYITNTNHDAVMIIARDGNIYTLGNSIALIFAEKEGFILITAYRGSEKIAEFHYQMNFFYTNK